MTGQCKGNSSEPDTDNPLFELRAIRGASCGTVNGVFTVVSEKIVLTSMVRFRKTQRAASRPMILAMHTQTLACAKFPFTADVFAAKRRVVQHPAIAESNAFVHHYAFATRNDVAW
jgi:hypothetical protein